MIDNNESYEIEIVDHEVAIQRYCRDRISFFLEEVGKDLIALRLAVADLRESRERVRNANINKRDNYLNASIDDLQHIQNQIKLYELEIKNQIKNQDY